MLLTELALPMGLLLTVGPLANVEIDGRRVPPKAISTSFGGCLKLKRKHGNSLRGSIPGSRSKSARRCGEKSGCQIKSSKKKEKKTFSRSTPHQRESGSGILAVCSSASLSALGIFLVKNIPGMLKVLFFLLRVARQTTSQYMLPRTGGSRAEEPDRLISTLTQNNNNNKKIMRSLRGDVSGESLSSVVMQQTGRLNWENRVRGILKLLGFSISFLLFLISPALFRLPARWLAETLCSKLACREVVPSLFTYLASLRFCLNADLKSTKPSFFGSQLNKTPNWTLNKLSESFFPPKCF